MHEAVTAKTVDIRPQSRRPEMQHPHSATEIEARFDPLTNIESSNPELTKPRLRGHLRETCHM